MSTENTTLRRRFGAGEGCRPRIASRPRHAVLAIMGLVLLTTATAILPVAAQTQAQTQGQTPTAKPAQNGPEVERFENWTLQCTRAQTDKPRDCFLIHDVYPTEGKVRILQVVVGRFGAENKTLGALFFVPLGVRLPPGVTIQIDNGDPQTLPIELCTTKGCQVQIALEEPLLSKFKAGNGGEVTFSDTTGRQVAVPFSLQGFSAALKKLP